MSNLTGVQTGNARPRDPLLYAWTWLLGVMVSVFPHCNPFNTGCLPLNYSDNPGVNGVSYRGNGKYPGQELFVGTKATTLGTSLDFSTDRNSTAVTGVAGLASPEVPAARPPARACTHSLAYRTSCHRTGTYVLTRNHAPVSSGYRRRRRRRRRGQRAVRDDICVRPELLQQLIRSLGEQAFPVGTPLQCCLFAPELQWQSRGK